jgi:hypothetical protein
MTESRIVAMYDISFYIQSAALTNRKWSCRACDENSDHFLRALKCGHRSYSYGFIISLWYVITTKPGLTSDFLYISVLFVVYLTALSVSETMYKVFEISSSHGGEYDVQNCLLGCSTFQKTALKIKYLLTANVLCMASVNYCNALSLCMIRRHFKLNY